MALGQQSSALAEDYLDRAMMPMSRRATRPTAIAVCSLKYLYILYHKHI